MVAQVGQYGNPHTFDFSAERVTASVHESLQRLQVCLRGNFCELAHVPMQGNCCSPGLHPHGAANHCVIRAWRLLPFCCIAIPSKLSTCSHSVLSYHTLVSCASFLHFLYSDRRSQCCRQRFPPLQTMISVGTKTCRCLIWTLSSVMMLKMWTSLR